jgi:hypothetical protein
VAGAFAKELLAGAEAASKGALTAELADAVMQETPRGMALLRYASMNGVSALEMADRLGQLAPDLAKGADSLSGFMKVMNSIGGLGEEGDAYAKLISLGSRFTGEFGDLSHFATMSKILLATTGLTTGLSGVTAIGATAAGGIEIDGPTGPTAVNWHFPVVGDWYKSDVQEPTTAAIPAGAADVAVDVATVAAPGIGIPMQAYRFTHGGW